MRVIGENDCLMANQQSPVREEAMIPAHKQLRLAETGQVVAERLETADTAWKRVVGLIGRKTMPPGTGLWLEPCNGIHTLLMRFPIDVLVLDRAGTVLRVVPHLRPWRYCGPIRGARIVVELPAGTLASIPVAVGSRLIQTTGE